MQARKNNQKELIFQTLICLKELILAESHKNFFGDIPNNFENLEIKTNKQFSISGPRFDINFNFFDGPFLIF